ncbi:hypothetical protein DPMN_055374 [Dreissena polymorpha]|uniref:Uncharacterized protein n=1 Tax=Dreissena polymorpha TaxID=45954 RepID=A0A9D4HU07_DREPO|nr:hypothetical protein DPMN_055374 [Dreissena polymorpha]
MLEKSCRKYATTPREYENPHARNLSPFFTKPQSHSEKVSDDFKLSTILIVACGSFWEKGRLPLSSMRLEIAADSSSYKVFIYSLI